MNTVVLGYIFAILSSIFSALYVIPKKITKQKPIVYVMFMGIGFFIMSVLGYVFQKAVYNIEESILNPNLIFACIGGIVFTIASTFVLTAIDKIGLAKANQWKSLQGPIGTFLILVLLSEFLTTKILFIVLAAIFLCTSAILFTVKDENSKEIDKKGIIYALLAALFFGIFALIQKHLTNKGLVYSQHIYISLFIFISAFIFILLKEKSIKGLFKINNSDTILSLTSGILYYFVSYFSTLAYKYIPGSIAFMIHQLNAVWLFLLGVIVFKEINFKKNWIRLSIGLICSLIGIFMLLLAKN